MNKTRKLYLETFAKLHSFGKTPWTRTVCDAITNAPGVVEPGMCSKQVRLCSLKQHGARYQKYFGASAKETGELFSDSPYSVPLENGGAIGDIYIWMYGHGKHGHIAVRMEGNWFAHNTISNARYGDGRGYIAMREMDAPDVIVRLP